jgi:hypothetical protein
MAVHTLFIPQGAIWDLSGLESSTGVNIATRESLGNPEQEETRKKVEEILKVFLGGKAREAAFQSSASRRIKNPSPEYTQLVEARNAALDAMCALRVKYGITAITAW